MPLTGQAKTDYQREYMRKRRSNAGSNNNPESVRPLGVTVRPERTEFVRPQKPRPPGISDNQWAYIQSKAEQDNE